MRFFLALLLTLTLLGCAPTEPPPDDTPDSESESQSAPAVSPAADKPVDANLPAGDILKRLLATYRKAKTYQDQGVVRLEFQQAGAPLSQEWPVSVDFERPNKLSLAAYQATVQCDGKMLRARIDDPETNNVDEQIVVRPAPNDLKLADLAGDPLLYDILSSRLRRQPIQLELLLESGGLVSAFEGGVACEKLADKMHGGRNCFRVEVPSPGGAFVFWVDQANFLLRRLDYPAAALVPELTGDPAVKDVQLYADLRGAAIGKAIPAAEFAMDVPAGAKKMKTFVIPPRPLPSELFGQEPAEFYFTDAEGNRITQADLQGKIAVLAWYHDNPACEATMQQVSLARQQLKDEADVAFYAVATDPTSTTDKQLASRLEAWKVDLPLVRDLEAFGNKAFQIELQPTVIVLDAKGLVQIFQTGGSPELADQLVTIVSRLKMGDDLAAEILARHEREQREYDALIARGGPEPGEIVELPEAVIRPRSEPARLKIERLWANAELKLPGNIVLAEAADQPAKVYVFEGWRTVAELNGAGKVVARHELNVPEQAAVTYARTALNQEGKRLFVASAPLAPALFVFDEAWQLVGSFPGVDGSAVQLTDLAFADVEDPDGQPEVIAASVADVGLMALSFDGESPGGKVRWRNRIFPNAVSIAVTQPDDVGSWGILATGETGQVLRVNRFGLDEPPVSVDNRSILKLVAAQFPAATQASLVGLSNDAQGELSAIGLTDKLKECWNYPLPAGVHQKPIEPITSSHLLPGHAGEWWLAGPDGSVHVITEDGEFHDSFHTGAVLTGIAATMLDDQPVLLIATEQGVEAWKVELPAARER